MKVTQDHINFYVSYKTRMFDSINKKFSIHTLINSQVNMDKNYCDKHNDLNLLRLINKRYKNNKSGLLFEISHIAQNSEGNRKRLFSKIYKRLTAK